MLRHPGDRPNDRGNKHLWNVGIRLPDYKEPAIQKTANFMPFLLLVILASSRGNLLCMKPHKVGQRQNSGEYKSVYALGISYIVS